MEKSEWRHIHFVGDFLSPLSDSPPFKQRLASLVEYIIALSSSFLVADTQLYKRLCPSVGPLVHRSVTTSRKVWE